MFKIILEVIKDFFIAGIGAVVAILWSNRKNLKLLFETKIKHRNDEVRLSISYLFRIKHNDKFLLIHGDKIQQYQPVGGVFKHFNNFENVREEFHIKHDNEFDRQMKDASDLRIRSKGKHVTNILNWFESRKNREISLYREFHEELINSGFLSMHNRLDFSPEYIKTVKTDLHFSNHFHVLEIIVYEIYNLEMEHKHICELESVSETKLIFATDKEISKECISLKGISVKIGEHSKHII